MAVDLGWVDINLENSTSCFVVSDQQLSQQSKQPTRIEELAGVVGDDRFGNLLCLFLTLTIDVSNVT